MSGNGREAVPDVRAWSGGPPGWFGRPSRMSGSGLETFPIVRECLRIPPKCPGVVGRPSRISGSGRESHQDVWQ